MLLNLLGIALGILYIIGIWKFLAGFDRTNFTQNRIGLALLWPVLFIMNGNYRRNFTKALKG
ncbi:hypothetical protein V2H45_04845 [Tumidithrix elongata RA019]|uniref:Uncharacterized protein n=1 Tax=Tumidithrix elongata BACA0141 TaxID=2716417 RepID=A0AAW9PV54_9CYAN|nr:hypothetical protein [Tumidithrix elongata RA019]